MRFETAKQMEIMHDRKQQTDYLYFLVDNLYSLCFKIQFLNVGDFNICPLIHNLDAIIWLIIITNRMSITCLFFLFWLG
jgi:hypothetical protein